MVGLVVYGNEEKKKGEKTVGLFKYFPKTVASTIRMSKFMQREGVLETLERIWLSLTESMKTAVSQKINFNILFILPKLINFIDSNE